MKRFLGYIINTNDKMLKLKISIYLFIGALFLILLGTFLSITIVFILIGIPIVMFGVILLVLSILIFFYSILNGAGTLIGRTTSKKQKISISTINLGKRDGIYQKK